MRIFRYFSASLLLLAASAPTTSSTTADSGRPATKLAVFAVEISTCDRQNNTGATAVTLTSCIPLNDGRFRYYSQYDSFTLSEDGEMLSFVNSFSFFNDCSYPFISMPYSMPLTCSGLGYAARPHYSNETRFLEELVPSAPVGYFNS